MTTKSLVERVDALTTANQRLADQQREATVTNIELKARVAELEDDLTAAHTSLRRVLKDTNRTNQER